MKITVLNFSQVKTGQKAETIAEVVSKFKSNFIITLNGDTAVEDAFKSEIQRRQPQYFNTREYRGEGTTIFYTTNKRASQLSTIEHDIYDTKGMSVVNGLRFGMSNNWYDIYLMALKQSSEVTLEYIDALLRIHECCREDIAVCCIYVDEGVVDFKVRARSSNIDSAAPWPDVVSKEHRTIISPTNQNLVLLEEADCLVVRLTT